MASLEIMSPNIVCKYMSCILYDVFSEINYYYYYQVLAPMNILVDEYNPNIYPKCYYDIVYQIDYVGRYTWVWVCMVISRKCGIII